LFETDISMIHTPEWGENSREMLDVITRALVCRVAIADSTGAPYVVPLCFGYSGQNFFFHGKSTGRKIDLLEKNPMVGFQIDADARVVSYPDITRWTMAYKSVIGTGKAVFIDDFEEKAAGLQYIVEHYAHTRYSIPRRSIEKTTVFRIEIKEITYKAA